MSWGYKILSVYILFVVGIMVMVFKSSMQNTDLVTPDYYEKELKYQQTIDESARTGKLSAKVEVTTTDSEIRIQLPPEMNELDVKATVLLYCPSDKRKDIKKEMTVKGATLVLPIITETKGAFDLKINWQANGITYYHEQKLILQ